MLAAGYSDVVIEEDGILRTDERYDRILELVGPAIMKDSMKHLVRGGILCNTGLLGGKWDLEGFEPIGDLAEDAYLTSFYSGNVREEHLSCLHTSDNIKFPSGRSVYSPSQILRRRTAGLRGVMASAKLLCSYRTRTPLLYGEGLLVLY